MAANTLAPFGVPSVQLTTAATTLRTTPVNSQDIIRRGVFTNVTGGAITVTIYRVPAAGSAGATNVLVSAYSIAANADYEPPALASLVLNAGESIQCLASANTSINATLSGLNAS